MRSYTGGFISMVTARAYVQLIKQKLSTKISTEFELVGVDDVLIQVIWAQ